VKKIFVFFLIIAILFGSIGCAAKGKWKKVGGGVLTGVAIGAATGAAAGSLYKKDRTKGALVGAGIGALLGGLVGGIKKYREYAVQEAAKTGKTVIILNEEEGKKIQADPISTSYEYVEVPVETLATKKGVSTGKKNTKKVKKKVVKVRSRTWESEKLTSDTYERVLIN